MKAWQVFMIVVVLVALVRSLTLYADIIQVDESDFAIQGEIWRTGGVPYVDFVEKKPPLSYAFYAVSFILFGYNMLSVHIIMILWVAAVALVLMYIARLLGEPRAGPWAAMFYATWTVCLSTTSALPANTEQMLALPSVLAVYAYLRSRKTSKQAWWLVFAGCAVAVASLFKHQGGILLPAICAYHVYEGWKGHKLRGSLTDVLVVCIGFAIPWVIVALYFWGNDALAEAFEWNIVNNMRYIGSGFGFARATGLFLTATGFFVIANAPIVILAALGVRRNVFFVVWLAFGMLAVSVGGRFSLHYYIQLYPPLIYMAAIGWVRMLQSGGLSRRFKGGALSLLAVVPIGFAIFHWITFFGAWYEPQQPVSYEVAQEIVRHTEKDDTVFVWGYFSYPYYRSRRKPASRFIIDEYLVPYWEKKFSKGDSFSTDELSSWHKKNFKLLMRDLLRNRPTIIVDTSGSEDFDYWKPFVPEKFPEFAIFLRKYYKPIANVRGMIVYKSKPI